MLKSAHTFRRVIRLAVVGAASVLVAACDRAPPTAPPSRSLAPSTAPRDSSLTCRSGYIIVDGRMVCGE